MNESEISLSALRRLPVYLHYLKSGKETSENVSATGIASALGLNDVQVRKDLASVSGAGRPKTGYNASELIARLEEYLGRGKRRHTVLAGAGNLGRALMSYGGFEDYGLDIVAAFDTDDSIIGSVIGGKKVYPISELGKICGEYRVALGIITVPASHAQAVCDMLVEYGIRAVWNFAPTVLRVPEGVTVENENLASSLAVLSRHLEGNNI